MYFLLYSFMNKLMSLRNKKKLHFVSVCLVISLELVCLLALEWFYLTREIDRFHCHRTKKKIENRLVKEAKKMICYKRLIFKQLVQVSGQFVAHSFRVICRKVSRTSVELCTETPYWCTVLVHQYGLRKSTKSSAVHFFYKNSFFHSKTSIGAHKHIF